MLVNCTELKDATQIFKLCHIYQRAVIKNKTFYYIHEKIAYVSDVDYDEFNQTY